MKSDEQKVKERMQSKHNLSEELSQAIAARMKEIESRPKPDLAIQKQKEDFAKRERETELKLNQDMVAVCAQIKKNEQALAKGEKEKKDKLTLIEDQKRANEMLGEALEGLLKDEQFVKQSLQEAKDLQGY